MHTGLKLDPRVAEGVSISTYSGGPEETGTPRMYASERGKITFTLAGPDGLRIENLSPGVPVEINVDNAVAAAAAAIMAGAGEREEVRRGLAEFRGARRRFEIWLDGTQKRGAPYSSMTMPTAPTKCGPRSVPSRNSIPASGSL